MPTFFIMLIIISFFFSVDVILAGTDFGKYSLEISIALLVALAGYVYFWMRKIRKQAESGTTPIRNDTHDFPWHLIPIAFFVLLWGGCVYRLSTPSFQSYNNETSAKRDLYFNCLKYYSSDPKDCESYR